MSPQSDSYPLPDIKPDDNPKMYQKGGYQKKSYTRTYRPRKKYVPSRAKKLVTGDREPTMVEQIANGVGSVAKLATAVMPIVSAINTELKYSDKTASVTAYNPGTNDQLIALTDSIAQGSDDTNRIGNSILAKDIQLRFAFSFPAIIGSPNVMGLHCRMMLICWKDNASQNIASISKIFETPSNLYSPVNKDNSESFVVLKDKFFTVESQAGIQATAGFKAMKFYKKLDWHMRFNGTSSGAGTTNHVFLILRSSATGSTHALGCTYYSRLNFTDN